MHAGRGRAGGSHLGDLLPTHEEHEDDSQDDAQADQHEGSVDHHVLLGDDRVERRGRGVVDDDALKEATEKKRQNIKNGQGSRIED